VLRLRGGFWSWWGSRFTSALLNSGIGAPGVCITTSAQLVEAGCGTCSQRDHTFLCAGGGKNALHLAEREVTRELASRCAFFVVDLLCGELAVVLSWLCALNGQEHFLQGLHSNRVWFWWSVTPNRGIC
jgi:hypothetical protein